MTSEKNNLTEDKIFMTQEAIDKLQQKLDNLINVVRPEVLYELSEARKQGDLSENADYDSAREKQAEIETEISKIQSILIRAEVVTEVNTEIVEISNIVEYVNQQTNKTHKVKIVSSSIEIDVFDGEVLSIALDSPIGEALIGKRVNDVVTIKAPSNAFSVKITKIS